MKRTALLLVALLFTHLSYSQKTESFVALNSGLFSFRGVSAQETSQINLSGNAATTGYTNNPFGAKNGLCYGVSYQVQHVSKGNFVIGIGIGYENLRSRTIINSVNGYTSAGTFQNPVFGQTYLTNQFINANPYLGYRVPICRVAIDLTGGFDVGYLLNSVENGKATGQNGERYSTSRDRTTDITVDVRPRLQVSAFYRKTGIYAGYSRGLMNYLSGYVGGRNECQSSLIRFGLLYKLNS